EGLPEQASGDAWATQLPGQDLVPAYLVSRFAAQYRVIVDVLLAAQDVSLTGMSYDEVTTAVRTHLLTLLPHEQVAALLAEDTFHLDARLEQLARWRVVTRWQDPARTGEDFLRRRDRYQLTPAAARLHMFWAQADHADEEAAADLTLAPRVIHERLAAFSTAIRDRDYQAASTEFQAVAAIHQATAKAARTWQRTLAHALSGGPDQAKQELLWRTLQSYIAMWGEQVDVHSPRIAALTEELTEHLTPQVWRACIRASVGGEPSEEDIAAHAQRWTQTWDALRSWFAGANGQARRLRRQLRDLVAPWARNMHILMDTGGAVTRRVELLKLATAIERAPSEETAWRIWDTAVGVFSARHLLLVAEAADDQTIPWHLAPPAPVTARFREHSVRAAVGRRTRTPDYSAGRNAARRARVAQVAARKGAEASLRRRSGSRFAEWDHLNDAELDLLLELLDTAHEHTHDGMRSSVTDDGRWRVTLTPPDGTTDGTAVLAGPAGKLATLNWLFAMEPV
ncbi:MAG: DUF2397 domain-containing protein, partial [Sciscionella sp.]